MISDFSTVLLFEDDNKHASKLETAFKRQLPARTKFVRFAPTSVNTQEGTYEDRLVKELKGIQYRNMSLIVCDRDLSLTKSYIGLSEAVVSKVANHLGIPICLYARGVGDTVLDRQREWGDGRIVLDCGNIEEMATKVAVLVKGFMDVKALVTKTLSLSGQEKLHSPAAMVANMLGRPESADKIGMYVSGDQKMISEILPFAQAGNKKGLKSRAPTLIGYWLYDSILRFPGLLVDTVAAASYLNIDIEDFDKNTDVQKLFNKALYKGPFADKGDPLWWRNDLDDILQAGKSVDGQAYVTKKLKKTVKPCMCSVDSALRAGWYCMATKKPVSLEKSKGNITWFPRGADLARISIDVYDEIGPWLGLY